MAFTGKEGNPIDLKTAREWVKKHQDNAEKGAVKSVFFGCDILNQILSQENEHGHCKGIRIFFSEDEKGQQHLLLVGATENEKNMILNDEEESATAKNSGFDDPIVGNDGHICPPICSVSGESL